MPPTTARAGWRAPRPSSFSASASNVRGTGFADVEHRRQRAHRGHLLQLRDAVHPLDDVGDALAALVGLIDPSRLIGPRRDGALDDAEATHDRGEGIVD